MNDDGTLNVFPLNYKSPLTQSTSITERAKTLTLKLKNTPNVTHNMYHIVDVKQKLFDWCAVTSSDRKLEHLQVELVSANFFSQSRRIFPPNGILAAGGSHAARFPAEVILTNKKDTDTLSIPTEQWLEMVN